MTSSVLVRAHDDPRVGLGHVMRCRAIAEAIRAKGHQVAWLGRRKTPNHAWGTSVTLTQGEDGSLAEAQEVAAFIRAQSIAAVVIDHRALHPRYLATVAETGVPTVALDDEGARDLSAARIVIDPNLGPRPATGRTQPETRLLAGPRYAPVRADVRGAPPPEQPNGNGRRILLALGGAPAPNLVAQAIERLDAVMPACEVRVAGRDLPEAPEVQAARGTSPHQVRLIGHVDDMGAELRQADIVVCGAGSTVWEACTLEVPMIAISLGHDQDRNAAGLKATQAAVVLTIEEALSERLGSAVAGLLARPDEAQRMAQRAHDLCDGQGATRIADHIESYITHEEPPCNP